MERGLKSRLKGNFSISIGKLTHVQIETRAAFEAKRYWYVRFELI